MVMGKHLTEQERSVIWQMESAGYTLREIGEAVDRHHTVVLRELGRSSLFPMKSL